MDTITLTLTTAGAVLAGALIGEYQRRRLNTLGYRYPDETADHWFTPAPDTGTGCVRRRTRAARLALHQEPVRS